MRILGLTSLVETLRMRKRSLAMKPCPGRIMVLANGSSASLTYLVEPYLVAQRTSYVVLDGEVIQPTEIDFSLCEAVLIVRYMPERWVSALKSYRRAGGKVIYFMDDDLLDEHALRNLPNDYARKLKKRILRHRGDLRLMCDEWLVSSPHLLRKYQYLNPILLQPRPSLGDFETVSMVKVCYHGTASHIDEIMWLVSLVEEMQQLPGTSFEIFGNHEVNKLYRGIKGVSVLHPMTWQNYVAFSSCSKRDIALAPLLPSVFNAARGPTKFFDFVRLGAVGIYTDVEPYKSFIRNQVDGILLPNDKSLWLRTIRELASDVERRERMTAAALERALSVGWSGEAEPTY